MNRLLFIPITFCVLLALNGCSIFQNSSVLTEKSYDLSDFTSVEIEDSSSLIIKSGDDYSINITCNENIVNYLVVYVSNGVLYASV
ncbi:MAG: DUF2807 domain-containing protein, partial [Spirochaetales bacterium]|nr:DUF2807 domain-containing protein [Spirochaetales bacterium]